MDVKEGLRYTDEHEWVRVEGDTGVVGVTAYAVEQLGDIVYVELPAVGTQLDRAQTFGVVESVKAVSDMFAPVGGEVVETNGALGGSPELLNSDPYGEGWIVKLRLRDPGEVEQLKDAAAYRDLVQAG